MFEHRYIIYLSSPFFLFLFLWIVYTCEFCARFHIKLARFAKKIFFFISKWASLVQKRPRNRANVKAPLKLDWSIPCLGLVMPSRGQKSHIIKKNTNIQKSFLNHSCEILWIILLPGSGDFRALPETEWIRCRILRPLSVRSTSSVIKLVIYLFVVTDARPK